MLYQGGGEEEGSLPLTQRGDAHGHLCDRSTQPPYSSCPHIALLKGRRRGLQPPGMDASGPSSEPVRADVHAHRSGQPTLMLIKCVYLCLFTD